MAIPHLTSLRAEMLSGRRLLPLYEAGVTGELLHARKTGNVFDFVEDGHGQNYSDSRYRAQQVEGLPVVELRLRDEEGFLFFDGGLEVINHTYVERNVSAHNASIEVLRDALSSSTVSDLFLEGRQIILIPKLSDSDSII